MNIPDIVIQKKNIRKSSSDQPKEHCWFYENGFCRNRQKCSFSHPEVMCQQFWLHGECDQDDKCIKRHPVQVCTRHLNNSCIQGRNCVHQHPPTPSSSSKQTQSPTTSKGFEAPKSPFLFNGFPGSNPSPNFPSVSTPPFVPTAPTQMYAQSRGSPAHHPRQEQHNGRYGQQQQQGNDHGHLGQQQGHGWPQ